MAAIDRRHRRERGRQGSRGRRFGVIAAGLGAFAGTVARGDGNSLDVRFLHYGESDGRTQVQNPELYFQHDFAKAGRLGLLLSYDSISGASPTGAGPEVVASSGASGGSSLGLLPTATYTDTRKAASLNYGRRFGSHLPSVTLSYSRESDYISRGFSLVDSWDLSGGRTTLHYGFGGTSDTIEPSTTPDRFTKRSRSLVAGWTQVLGPRDLLDVSLGLDAFHGYLTDPYKVVTIAGTNVPEIRPDSRSRKSALFKYGHYLTSRGALKLTYRYYWDDWSLKAHTIDLLWDQRVGRKLILSPQLRYYRQGNADFFGYEFKAPEPFMSSDYRLSSFWSWLAGIGLTVEVRDNVSLNLAATYQDQTGIDRISPTGGATPPPAEIRRLRYGRILAGEGGDDEGGGGGGSRSLSPADMKVITLTLGVSMKF